MMFGEFLIGFMMFKFAPFSSEEDGFHAVNMGVHGRSVSSMNLGLCRLYLEQYGRSVSDRCIC